MAFNIKKAWKALREPTQTVQQRSSGHSGFVAYALGGDPNDAANKGFAEIAKLAYERNVVGYRCVSLIANAVGSLCPLLYKGDDELEQHDLLTLLDRPNFLQGKGAFLAHATGSLLLDGNLFIERNGPDRRPPKELWVQRPDYVRVQPGPFRLPSAYVYTPSTTGLGDKRIYPVNQLDGDCDLLHVMSYSPLFETEAGRGLSPLKAVWLQLLTHTEGQRWNQSLLQNGARLSGAFVEQRREGVPPLTQEQIDQLREDVRALYQGSGNAGNVAIVPADLAWQELSLNPKDADWINSKNSSAADIALSLGVPPQLVGIAGSLTFANYEQARLAFYEDTVLPLGYMLMDELNRWLVPKFGDDLRLAIDEDKIIALEPKREMKWTRANTSTFLTINEKREMVGYDNIGSAGDSILVSTSVLPLDANIDDSETGDEGDGE